MKRKPEPTQFATPHSLAIRLGKISQAYRAHDEDCLRVELRLLGLEAMALADSKPMLPVAADSVVQRQRIRLEAAKAPTTY